jgi:acetyl esterase/lipase
LRASNGLTDVAARYEYGWNVETIVAENRRAWLDVAMSLDRELLAFGGDGAGGWFCLALAPQDDARVFHWSWIDGHATPVADDLRAFWPAWFSGELKV